MVVTIPVASAAADPQTPCDNGNPTDLCTNFSVVPEAPGENCVAGGFKITFNDSVSYVCNGPAGTTGAAGNDGSDGTNGTDGVNGVDGTNGTNGANGTNGVDGTDLASCVSHRTFTIRLHERKGHRLSRATVSANNIVKKAKRVHGRLTAKVSFVGYHGVRGQVVPVLIRGVDHGKKVRSVRLYRICTPSQGVSLLNLPATL